MPPFLFHLRCLFSFLPLRFHRGYSWIRVLCSGSTRPPAGSGHLSADAFVGARMRFALPVVCAGARKVAVGLFVFDRASFPGAIRWMAGVLGGGSSSTSAVSGAHATAHGPWRPLVGGRLVLARASFPRLSVAAAVASWGAGVRSDRVERHLSARGLGAAPLERWAMPWPALVPVWERALGGLWCCGSGIDPQRLVLVRVCRFSGESFNSVLDRLPTTMVPWASFAFLKVLP
ncbi:hypothetical protein SEVIR_2G071901v4 [Setaria viridis]